jgi:hypothetical protein
MARRIGILLMALIATVSFLHVTYAQMAEKGWEKTVTLTSGEVILDMSGEWDSLYERYGLLSRLGSYPDILTITQDGNTFVAVKQIGSEHVPKGAETIKGILDKDGFKEVQIYRIEDWAPCTCEISENGNKIVFSDGGAIQATLNRK